MVLRLMYLLVVGLGSLCISIPVNAQDHLYPMRKNYKWGFMNQKGEWAIPPRYTTVSQFHHGVAAVAKGKHHWQLIDKKGEPVIDREFRAAGWSQRDHRPDIPMPVFDHFSDNGWIPVDKVYYDPTGKIVLDLKDRRDIKSVEGFHNGLAAAMLDEGYGFIDTSGNIVIQGPFEEIKPFSEERAAVSNQDRKWGVIDKNGDTIAPFKYEEIGRYSQKRAWFELHHDDERKDQQGEFGFLDRSGKEVIPPKYDAPWDPPEMFRNNRYPVEIDHQEFIYINRSGEKAFQGTFKEASAFNEGFALVKKKGMKYYSGDSLIEKPPRKFFVDPSGNPKIESHWIDSADHIWPFNNGLAKMGFELKNGSPHLTGNGEYKMMDKGVMGYMDRNGKMVKIQSPEEAEYMSFVLDSTVKAKERAKERARKKQLEEEKRKLKDCPEKITYGDPSHSNWIEIQVLGHIRKIYFQNVALYRSGGTDKSPEFIAYFPPFGLKGKDRIVANQNPGGGFFSSMVEQYMDDLSRFVLILRPGSKHEPVEFVNRKLVHLDCMNRIDGERFGELWDEERSNRKASIEKGNKPIIEFSVRSQKNPEHYFRGRIRTSVIQPKLSQGNSDPSTYIQKHKGADNYSSFSNAQYYPEDSIFRYKGGGMVSPYKSLHLPDNEKGVSFEHHERFTYLYRFIRSTAEEFIIEKYYIEWKDFFPEWNNTLLLPPHTDREELLLSMDLSEHSPSQIIHAPSPTVLHLQAMILEPRNMDLWTKEEPEPVPSPYFPSYQEDPYQWDPVPPKIGQTYFEEWRTHGKGKKKRTNKVPYLARAVDQNNNKDRRIYSIDLKEDRDYHYKRIFDKKLKEAFNETELEALYSLFSWMTRKGYLEGDDVELKDQKTPDQVNEWAEKTGLLDDPSGMMKQDLKRVFTSFAKKMGEREILEVIPFLIVEKEHQELIDLTSAFYDHLFYSNDGASSQTLQELFAEQGIKIDLGGNNKENMKRFRSSLDSITGSPTFSMAILRLGQKKATRSDLLIDGRTGRPKKWTLHVSHGYRNSSRGKIEVWFKGDSARIHMHHHLLNDSMMIPTPKGILAPYQFTPALANLPLKRGYKDSLVFLDFMEFMEADIPSVSGEMVEVMKYRPIFLKATLEVLGKEKVEIEGFSSKTWKVKVHFHGNKDKPLHIPYYGSLYHTPRSHEGYAIYYLNRKAPHTIKKIELPTKEIHQQSY